MLKKLLEHWAIISIAVPIYGTVVHMRYEQGYLEYFGVPLSAFQPSLVGMLLSLAKVGGPLFITLILWLAVNSLGWIRSPLLKRIQQTISVFIPVSVPIMLIAGGDALINFLIAVTFCMLLINMFRVSAAERQKFGGYWGALEDRIAYFDNPPDDAEQKISLVVGSISAALLVAFVLAYGVGANAAAQQKTFFVFSNNPEQIVVKQYADLLICVGIDSSIPPETTSVIFLTIGEQPVSLIQKEIGPILPAEQIEIGF